MDQPIYKLGKLDAIHDPRSLMLSEYITPDLPPTPPEYAYEPIIDGGYQMLLNDKLGCCTIAGPYHLQMTWAAYTQKPFLFENDDIIRDYSAVSGYNPVTGENDNGAAILNVMKYWVNTGMNGHKLDAFAKISANDLHMIKTGIFLFEGVNIGVMLPANAQGKDKWEYMPGRGAGYGSWGGHDVVLVAYDSDYFTCVTWGKLLKMSWRFLLEYCDEVHAPVSKDMITEKGLAANGFRLDELLADARAISQ